jgi:hypothetical protein
MLLIVANISLFSVRMKTNLREHFIIFCTYYVYEAFIEFLMFTFLYSLTLPQILSLSALIRTASWLVVSLSLECTTK